MGTTRKEARNPVKDVLDDVSGWRDRGDRVAIATVVAVKRSAPRPPGAKMAVNEHGEVSGAVSGGCVEGAVVEAAAEVLGGDGPKLLHFGIADSDAWDVGLPCGGEIDVFVEENGIAPRPAEPGASRKASLSAQGEFARIAGEDGRAALVSVIAGGDLSAKLLVSADGATEGGLGNAELDRVAVEAAEELMWAERSEQREAGEITLFVDVTAPAPRLVVFGAVDYAAALCRLARAAGWRPFVCDPRSQFATPDRFPEADEVIAAWPDEAFARIGGIDRATYVAVLTHDPKLDDAALELALRSEAPYVGAMGSRRAQAQRRERLLAAGLEEDLLDRIAAPIGLDLGAVTPEETALSIMAEVVAVRNGRDGARLSEAGGRIHEVGA
jgi:xanthine dehydrogenase accessory factor